MRFLPVKFYDSGAEGDEGGGIPNAAEGQNPEAGQQSQPQSPESFLTADQAKELGIESLDELKQWAEERKANKVTDEERKRQANLEEANFVKFAAEKNMLTLDEINDYKSLKSKSDRDLVYEDFVKSFKEDEPECTPEEIEEEFNSRYPLNSERKAAKKIAEKAIAERAASIRNPLSSRYESAKEDYGYAGQVASKTPEFLNFIKDTVKESAPEKLLVHTEKDGDTEIPFEIDISDAERVELQKLFATQRNFEKFFKGEVKLEDFKKQLKEKINSIVISRHFGESLNKALEIGRGSGTRNGSNIGANNPFSVIRGNSPDRTKEPGLTIEETNNKIREARQRYAR